MAKNLDNIGVQIVIEVKGHAIHLGRKTVKAKNIEISIRKVYSIINKFWIRVEDIVRFLEKGK